jgi:nitroimidazol reductase NimA-like FMN-containing flavoprotein (pyridoxamine 5'-phosphate oxidase superfamily)
MGGWVFGLCRGAGRARIVGAMDEFENTGIQHLTIDMCWRLLRATDVGRLAVVVSARPEIFPVNFVVDRGTLVFRTGEGTKLAAATIWPAVAFEVDGVDAAAGEAWSVVVKGTARELKGLYEQLEAEDLPLAPLHTSPKNRFLRIEPDEISGRRFRTVPAEIWASPLRGIRRAAPE